MSCCGTMEQFRATEGTLNTLNFKKKKAFEIRCYRRLLNISYKDKIQGALEEHYELLTLTKKRKLGWFDHIARYSSLAKTILQCTMKGKRNGGRQKKRWEDNIRVDRTGLC